MSRKKKPGYIKLGDISPQYAGWIIDKHGIKSPEGELFKEPDMRYFHWQGQILARMRYRLNNGLNEQGELF